MSARRVSLIALCLGFAAAAAWAGAPSSPPTTFGPLLWDRGLKTFAQACALRQDAPKARELFARAADDLHQGLASREDQAEACHDLGNACLLAGRLPEAIQAFQRGLKLAPQDRALRSHLEYARAMVVYGTAARGKPAEKAWPTWLPVPSPSQLAWSFLAFYALGFVALTRGSLSGQSRWHVLAAVAFLGLIGIGFCWHRQAQRDQAIVIVAKDDLPLRLGNGPSYPAHPDLPYLSRGMEAKRLAQRGDWLRIQFGSGEIGWAPSADVLVVD